MLRPATDADAAAILALRETLAAWQRSRGIRQWEPGEITREQIAEQVRRDEWRVLVEPDAGLVAAVRIVNDDPIWADADRADAGYIHGLMVARARAGTGLGKRVLQEAEEVIRARGRDVARLDCVASNAALRAYYEAQGYEAQGERDFPPESGWHPVLLLQKKLAAIE